MPLVVVDTSVALPATLSPRGLARKFWVLLAYGALTYRAVQLRFDLDQLLGDARAGVGEPFALDAIARMAEQAEERRDGLAALLPPGTADDWHAAGSAYLFSEYERKLRSVAPKLGVHVDDDDVARLRRQVEATCVTAPPPFEPGEAPTLTRDPDDDPIVYTALRVDADFLVSDDKDIVPGEAGEQPYELSGRRVLAVRFDRLLNEYLTDVAWDQIDGAWLVDAYRRLEGR